MTIDYDDEAVVGDDGDGFGHDDVCDDDDDDNGQFDGDGA